LDINSGSPNRGHRGGDWFGDDDLLSSSLRGDLSPFLQLVNFGFRVASIPEPSSLMLLGMGLAPAIAREILKKGKAARFKKAEKGKFALVGA